jgi:hypothetical protein
VGVVAVCSIGLSCCVVLTLVEDWDLMACGHV